MSKVHDAYQGKSQTYHSGVREDYLAELVEEAPNSVLEIGCGTGDLGAATLESGCCSRYLGVELVDSAGQQAKAKLTDVIIGDLESTDIPEEFGNFDALVASEVLEHLRDPWEVLRRLRTRLNPGALVLASSPNVANKRIIWMLLRGEWKLEGSGIMDQTHLRWFTPSSYVQMFRDCGYEVEHVRPVAPLRGSAKIVHLLSGGRLDHLFWTQTSVRARVPQTGA